MSWNFKNYPDKLELTKTDANMTESGPAATVNEQEMLTIDMNKEERLSSSLPLIECRCPLQLSIA